MLCKIFLPFQNTFRLPSLPKDLQTLISLIQDRLADSTPKSISLKYRDPEHDFINLETEEDLQTAVLANQTENINTLEVFVTLDESSQNSFGIQSCPEFYKRPFMLRKANTLAGNISNFNCIACENGIKTSPQGKCSRCMTSNNLRRSLTKFGTSVSLKASGLSTPVSKKNNLSTSMMTRSIFRSQTRSERKQSYSGKIQFGSSSELILSLAPSQEYSVTINVKNNGDEQWPEGMKISCVNGVYRHKEAALLPLESKATQVVTLALEAPQQVGKFLSQWRLSYNDGENAKSFGQSLFLNVYVEEKIQANNPQEAVSEQDEDLITVEDNTVEEIKATGWTFSEKSAEEKSKGASKVENIQKFAEYLNEIFPGSINEKFGFLTKNKDRVQESSITGVVEMYLMELCKPKMERVSSRYDEAERKERH